MREQTRRDVLKKGSIITSGLLISGQVSAKSHKPDQSKYSFTLRRGRSGKPIKPSKIEKRETNLSESTHSRGMKTVDKQDFELLLS